VSGPGPAALAPVRISADGAVVRAVALRGEDLSHAFFDDSVAALGDARPVATRRLGAGVDDLPEDLLDPHYVILHAGRCGSTAAARVLGTASGRPRLAEPSVLNQCAWSAACAPEEEGRRRWLARYATVVAMLQGALGARSVLKATSWNVAHAADLRRLFPSAWFVVVLRDPVEVLRSVAADPPRWVATAQDDDAVARRLHRALGAETTSPLVLDSLVAALWTCTARQALALRDGGRCRTSWHAPGVDLVAEAEGWCAAAGDVVTADRRRRATDEQRWYSKARDGQVAFDPAGAHRRAPLAPDREAHLRDLTAGLRSALAAAAGPPPVTGSAR
jgi:hypothetical protein